MIFYRFPYHFSSTGISKKTQQPLILPSHVLQLYGRKWIAWLVWSCISGGFKNQHCHSCYSSPCKIIVLIAPPKNRRGGTSNWIRDQTCQDFVIGVQWRIRQRTAFLHYSLKPTKFVLGLPKWKFGATEGPHHKLLTGQFSFNPALSCMLSVW